MHSDMFMKMRMMLKFPDLPSTEPREQRQNAMLKKMDSDL